MKRFPAKGFTLLELLVTAIILTLLSVVIVQVFISTMRTNSKTETVQDVKGSGDRAIDMMTRLVQNAKSIHLPTSPASCNGEIFDTVTLTNADGEETTFSCIELGGVARIASVSGSVSPQTVYLTNTDVTLVDPTNTTNTCSNNALAFTCTLVGDVPGFITIGFSLRQINSSASTANTAAGTFQTTVVLRNK